MVSIFLYELLVSSNKLSWQIIGAMHHIVHLLDVGAEKKLSDSLKINFAQFQLMMMLDSEPGQTQKAVADCLGITEAAVSRQVSSLESQDLISRSVPDQNRRQNLLFLTQKGKKILKMAIDSLMPHIQHLFGGLEDAEQKCMMSACNKLISRLNSNL